MERDNELLAPVEFMSIIIGNMIGTGILTLPAKVSKYAHEDGWIAILIGAAYPLYLVILGIYISKKYPNNNILELGRKYCGKFAGNMFNGLFLINFLFNGTIVLTSISNIIRVYVSYFIPQYKSVIAILIVVVYTSFKKLKLIGRLNLVVFFVTITFLMIPGVALKNGSILNISPIFSAGIKDIFKASVQSVFAYAGVESFFLIYPFVNDKKK